MTNSTRSEQYCIVSFNQEADHVEISIPHHQPIERDLHQEPNDHLDNHQSETNEIPTQEITVRSTPATEVQSIDGYHDSQSKPNVDVNDTVEQNNSSLRHDGKLYENDTADCSLLTNETCFSTQKNKRTQNVSRMSIYDNYKFIIIIIVSIFVAIGIAVVMLVLLL